MNHRLRKTGGRRRPCTQLATLGLAGHVFFELGAGVGMPLASLIGPTPAAALWTTSTSAAWRAARSAPSSGDRAFAVGNGLAMAAVVGHLTSWPRRRTAAGLPWLEDCEGLGRAAMPAYNSILYFCGATTVVALARENRAAPRWVGLLCLVGVPLISRAQHAEFRRLKRLAAERPGWWNRRLQGPP
jgi:hypothetical protein